MKKEELKFLYEVDEGSLSSFRKIGPSFSASDLGLCLCALEKIRLIDEYKDCDGFGEWFYAPLPMKDMPVLCYRRNPFAGGIVLSPVELPWLEKKGGANG